MRLNLAPVILMMLTGYGLTQYLDRSKAPAGHAPQKAADFSFRTLDGTTHALSGFRGKVVLLNFWASWCAPCIREFPTLLNAAEQNKNHAVLVALSYDLDDSAMMRFLETMKKKGHNWEKPHIYVARDDQDIAGKLFGTTKFPETFIIDGAGQIRDKFIGADWDISGLNAGIGRIQQSQMEDLEKRFERKIFKIGRNAAYALGGALGCWFLSLVYPHPEKAEHIARALDGLAWLLSGYGAFMFAVILLKKRLAPLMNLLFIGFVIPPGALYIFVNNWPR